LNQDIYAQLFYWSIGEFLEIKRFIPELQETHEGTAENINQNCGKNGEITEDNI